MVATLKTSVVQEPSSGTANLTLDASGGVTVGQNLTVAGTTTFTGGSTFTGNATAAAFIPSGSTVPTNGLYRPAANTVGLATNSTNALYIDSSQNVGIGTSSPSYKLHVANSSATSTTLLANILARLQANASGADASLQFSDNVANSAGISLNQGSLVTSIAGGEVMRVNTSGNVGIGTASPTGKLDVVATSATSYLNVRSSGIANAAQIVQDTGGTAYFQNTYASGDVIFGTAGNNAIFKTASTERMRIDSSGNLLVGTTTSPGTSGIALGSGLAVTFSYSGYSSYRNNMYLGSLYWNNGSDRMVLDSSGNLLVGTTSNTGSYRVNIKATDNNQLRLDNDGSTSTGMVYSNNGTGKVYSYWHNAQARYYITFSTGGVYIAEGATSWTSASDERVKDIIEPITDAASKVSNLRAVIGKYKTDDEGTRRSFLIAQDIQSVLPEAVDTTDPENFGVRYTDVIPLLVAAITELKAELDALKTKVGA